MEMKYYCEARDYGNVYRLMTSPEVECNIMNKPGHNDFSSFQKWFSDTLLTSINDFYVFYLDNEFIGITYTTEFRIVDGHCSLTTAIVEKHQKKGYGSLCTILTLKELFKKYPLRKVFFKVYSTNNRSFESIENSRLEKIAIIKEYRYCDGSYDDLYIYSLGRSDMESICEIYKKRTGNDI